MRDGVPNSPFLITPERGSEFVTSLDDFDLILTNDRPWKFCADPTGREIFVSRGAVELLWCASLAHFLFYARLVGGRKVDSITEIDLRADPKVRNALELLRWAIISQLKADNGDDWPSDLPAPQTTPPDGEENAANELCLVSCAFILHHELAHVRLMHSARVSDELSISQEKEADIAAAEWVLGGISDSGPIYFKRLLGIVQAFLLTTIMTLYKVHLVDDRGHRRHPFPYDRLTSLLDRYAPGRSHPAKWIAFVILDLHFQNSGRKMERNAFPDPEEGLNAICDELAKEFNL